MENPTIDSGSAGGVYVDTPRGIFTASGIWFASREAELENYAGKLLEKISLERLVKEAEIWIRSAQTLTLWLLPVLLMIQKPLVSVAISFVFYFCWESFGALMVNRLFTPFLRFLDNVAAQAGLYIIVLSMLGMQGQHIAVIAGLVSFILLRWGVLNRLLKNGFEWLRSRFFPLPHPDQILKSLIIRYALYFRIDLPQLAEMERGILQRLNQFRKR